MSKTEVGDSFYLFKSDKAQSGSAAGTLVISAHGMYWSREFGGFFEVPSPFTLYFYSPHKTALEDPGMRDMLASKVFPYESKKAGDMVRNYRLSKFQGEEETYSSIQKDLDKTDGSVDVLTIRNRWFDVESFKNRLLGGVTLKTVLLTLKDKYSYKNVLCSFCRIGTAQMLTEPLLGTSDLNVWSASKNKRS